MHRLRSVFLALCTIILVGFSAERSYARINLLTDEFSSRPDIFILNGERHIPEILGQVDLDGDSRLVTTLWNKEKDGRFAFAIVEKYKKDRLISDYSDSGKEILYTYGEKTLWMNISFLERLPRVTPWFMNCDPARVQACYAIKKISATFEVIRTLRDGKQVIVGGTLHQVYFAEDGQAFEKWQKFTVTYPRNGVMRVDFEDSGTSWAFQDAWQEYRTEDGKLVMEVCRNVPFTGYTCSQ